MQKVYQTIRQVAKSDVSVLITGETGTGKELCAMAIHQASLRQSKPFMTLNCATMPYHLIESELYGHIKGAFTGATHEKMGIAQAANQGSLFLDEIGEMDFDLQSKLLRFIETGTFYSVGSHRLQTVDVRFIAATNRELQNEIEANRFRSDIYYRLRTISIHLPPLRERGSDILLLAQNFLNKLAKKEQKNFTRFTTEAEKILLSYCWPGNVRQLQHVIHGLVLLHEGEEITAHMLHSNLEELSRPVKKKVFLPETNLMTDSSANLTVTLMINNTIQPFNQIEQEILLKVLNYCRGQVVEASDLLGISHAKMYRKLREWNIPIKKLKKKFRNNAHQNNQN